MTATKPPLTERLSGLRQCGCTDAELCRQHYQAMSRAEQVEYRRTRGARGTGRGRGQTEEQK
jgi:hypothetical protein